MISFEGSVAAVGFAIGLLFQLLAAFTKNRKVKLKTKGLKRQFNSAVSKLPICALLVLNFVLSQILLAICFNRSGYEVGFEKFFNHMVFKVLKFTIRLLC